MRIYKKIYIKELNQSKNVVYHLQDYLEICWAEIFNFRDKIVVEMTVAAEKEIRTMSMATESREMMHHTNGSKPINDIKVMPVAYDIKINCV